MAVGAPIKQREAIGHLGRRFVLEDGGPGGRKSPHRRKTMTPQQLNAAVSTLGTVISAIAASIFIVDTLRPREGSVLSSKGGAWAVAVLLVCSACIGVWVSCWIFMYRPEPVVTRTVAIEKTVPCPAAKTGSAISRGAISPAISGNGNAVNYGEQSAPKP
jgi:hypothetical protein